MLAQGDDKILGAGWMSLENDGSHTCGVVIEGLAEQAACLWLLIRSLSSVAARLLELPAVSAV